MTNFSQRLAEKIDYICDDWVKAVRQDRQIQSAEGLPGTAIQDHLAEVLQAMVRVLAQDQVEDIQLLVQDSLHHGALRANQGFEPQEIAQEYALLHKVIVTALEADLLEASSAQVLQVLRLLQAMVNAATAQCFRSYTAQRLGELEQLQNQLTLTNQELTRLVHAHQEHLSHLAHELKTPLNSIIGYSQLVLRQQLRASEAGDTLASLEHIERVVRNGQQLLHLINDTLELSRAHSGKIQLHLTTTDVRPLLQEVLQTIEPLAEVKELQIKTKCEDAPPQVLTDPFRLQQILTNLLSNAVRYTDLTSKKWTFPKRR